MTSAGCGMPGLSAEHTFVTSDGSVDARFRGALETGNELPAIATARGLLRVPLDHVLRICLPIRSAAQARYERAAVR